MTSWAFLKLQTCFASKMADISCKLTFSPCRNNMTPNVLSPSERLFSKFHWTEENMCKYSQMQRGLPEFTGARSAVYILSAGWIWHQEHEGNWFQDQDTGWSEGNGVGRGWYSLHLWSRSVSWWGLNFIPHLRPQFSGVWAWGGASLSVHFGQK